MTEAIVKLMTINMRQKVQIELAAARARNDREKIQLYEHMLRSLERCLEPEVSDD